MASGNPRPCQHWVSVTISANLPAQPYPLPVHLGLEETPPPSHAGTTLVPKTKIKQSCRSWSWNIFSQAWYFADLEFRPVSQYKNQNTEPFPLKSWDTFSSSHISRILTICFFKTTFFAFYYTVATFPEKLARCYAHQMKQAMTHNKIHPSINCKEDNAWQTNSSFRLHHAFVVFFTGKTHESLPKGLPSSYINHFKCIIII